MTGGRKRENPRNVPSAAVAGRTPRQRGGTFARARDFATLRAVRLTDRELEVALPILLREQRSLCSPILEELLERMLTAARRRELDSLLVRLRREASPQSEGPAVAGPSAVEREAED